VNRRIYERDTDEVFARLLTVIVMIEFVLIAIAVAAALMFLSWEPVRQIIQGLLGLSVLAILVFAISLVIWLALRA
jgi:hypothetical protein